MELKPLLLYAGDNLECLEGRPLPSVAEKPYSFSKHLPVSALPGDALVYSQSGNKRFAYIGVLKDTRVEKETRTLTFSHFEPFRVRVVALDEDLGITGLCPNTESAGFPPDFSYVTTELLELVSKLGSRDLAKEFACRFITMLQEDSSSQQAIARVSSQADLEPQKELHWLIEKLLAVMADELQLSSTLFRSDFEGNARNGKQIHSYPLLGTWCHPDAAILAPFRCAIEYDRQPAERNTSHLKVSLGKTAAHILSGAYDAAIQVFLLRADSDHNADTYMTDGVGTTKRFLQRLNQLGVFLYVGRPS
ncbi:MAG: hypothetical protein HY961_21745 [Ignavibacteriae bacterium]|nr:hypothetical protein [Ignavibacteriota bacterium]